MDTLSWLQQYFGECCNGDWEHLHVLKIETLDNPGWSVDIDLTDTTLEDQSFSVVETDRSESDWFFCRVEEGIFKGRGGAGNLEEILTVFRKWVESHD